MTQQIKLLSLAILLVASTAAAQSELTVSGVVSEQGSGKPLEGAKVTVVGGKVNDAVTDSNGTFILTFPNDVKLGTTVRIHVEKPGYIPFTTTTAVSSAIPVRVDLERVKGISNKPSVALPKPEITEQSGHPITFKEESPDVFTIELYKGSRAMISRSDLTEKGWGPFMMGNERPFSIYLENGKLYAEAKIYNGPGLPAVEVKKSEFIVRPMNWDRNFTDSALEIVNERSQPVLQVIYKRKGLIQIQGIFRGAEGGLIFEAPELPEALPRLFKYPSWKYQGQYAEASDQDVSPLARATDSEIVVFVRKWLQQPEMLIRSSKPNALVMHSTVENLMTWFYEKAILSRIELLRRLNEKGNPETDRLYRSLDPQSNIALADDVKIASFSKILEDIEALVHQIESKNTEGNNYQPTITPPSQTSPPPVQDIRIVSQNYVSSDDQSAPYKLRVVLQTNVVIQPVSFVFECSEDIEKGNVFFSGDSAVMFVKTRSGVILEHKNAFLASFESPAFTPEKPMILTLYSQKPIKVVRFGQIPFTF